MDLGSINRIYHWFSMQTEKSQPKGKQIMPETRLFLFPALSIDSRAGISRSTLENDNRLFSLPITGKIKALKRIFTITSYGGQLQMFFRVVLLGQVKNVCKQLTSLLVSCMSCLSPWARHNFPALLKIEQTLSHR